jgi:hypothetical protein
MDVRPNEPRSISGVFEDALRIYRGIGRDTWLLAFALEFAAAVPSIAWQLHLMSALSSSLQDPMVVLDALTKLPSSPLVWSLTLIAIPVYLILYNALIANVNWFALGRPAAAGRAIGVGLRTLPRALALGAVVTCIVAVGFLLLLVPGIYWAGTLQLAFIALVVEDTGVSQSMAASRSLIQGHWWRAATLLSYVIMIELLAYFAGTVVTAIAVRFFGADGSAALTAAQVISLAIDTLIAPLSAAVYVAMYHDLKLRKQAAGPAGDREPV